MANSEIETFTGRFMYLYISANRQWPEASDWRNHLPDKISTILLETRRCAAAIKCGQKYIRPRYALLLLNTVYMLRVRSEHILTATCGVATPDEN